MLNSQGKKRLVYSTEAGRCCPRCGRPLPQCLCRQGRKLPGDGIIRVQREVKGRRGKTVTTLTGIQGDHAELKELTRKLKCRCGTGGSAKEGVIIIQGDHRDTIIAELTNLGYSARRSGG